MMVSTRSQPRTGPVTQDVVASTADQAWAEETDTVPQRPPMTSGETARMPTIHLRDTLTLITEATIETQIFNNMMRAVTEAMNRQQGSFIKMLED